MKRMFLIVILMLGVLLIGCEKTPKIEMILGVGQDTVEINTEWLDAGATLKVENKSYNAEVDEEVDTTTIGLYKIEYHYKYKGKEYKMTRYVQVVDQTKPEIQLNPGIDTIKVGEEWTDARATVTDNSLEELQIIITGEVDTNKIGTYEIVYKATDSSGNTSLVTRYVHVVE